MIGRALRAQACSVAGDVVLLGVAVAAFMLSLSLATSIPPEFATAPDDARAALTAPFDTVFAMYGAVLAAVYGSFRYTIDRRDGVVAQRLMSQRRWTFFLVRMPTAAVGGLLVALAATVGGHLALTVAMGGAPVDWSAVASTLAVGAVAGLWGLGVGVVVQVHLVALFVTSLSLSGAMLVGMFWSEGAVYLPLLSMLEAFRFDLAAVGIGMHQRLDHSVAVLVVVVWVLVALVAGAASFLNRDVE